MTEQAKPTSGPCVVGTDGVRVHPDWRDQHGNLSPDCLHKNGHIKTIASVGPEGGDWRPFYQQRADAHLIAEAFNVYHETGLTPSKLAEQRAELLGALEPFALIAEHDIGTDESDGDDYRPMQRHNVVPRVTVGHLRRALAAIAKARGGSDA